MGLERSVELRLTKFRVLSGLTNAVKERLPGKVLAEDRLLEIKSAQPMEGRGLRECLRNHGPAGFRVVFQFHFDDDRASVGLNGDHVGVAAGGQRDLAADHR